MLESPFAWLFEKYSLHLSQKDFKLVATFKFSKYFFMCFLLSYVCISLFPQPQIYI